MRIEFFKTVLSFNLKSNSANSNLTFFHVPGRQRIKVVLKHHIFYFLKFSFGSIIFLKFLTHIFLANISLMVLVK